MKTPTKRATRRLAASLAIITALATAAPLPSLAADRTWTGGGADALWNTAGNWDTVPESTDSLKFRNSSVVGRTATLNGNYT